MTDAQRVCFVRNTDVAQYTTTIPGYWKEHLAEKIQKIHERQIAAGMSGASFGLVTDVHCSDNMLHSPALMEAILTECGIPYFYNAGDFVSGMGIIKPEDLIKEIMFVRRLFGRIADKQLMAFGNHDAAYSTFEPPAYYAESLSRETVHEYVFRPQMNYANRVFSEDGMSYYADDVFHKVRHIVLNTHDTPSDELKEDGLPVYSKFHLFGFRNEQINWFANVALDVPSPEWTVVLCTHESVGSSEMKYNLDLMLDIINAFRKHTSFSGSRTYDEIAGYDAQVDVDFTGKGGDFAVWVGGHMHQDIGEYTDGILRVSTLNDSLHNSSKSSFRHVPSTITEQAIDVFTINKKEHKLYATRIGCGEDREFTYEVF